MKRTDLVKNILDKGSFLCVGLDPDPAKMPATLAALGAEGLFTFNRAIIDATAPYAVAYKPNLAFYEAFGAKGVEAFERTCAYIKGTYPEMLLIADAKRGDIGNTARMYAKAFFEDAGVDAVTLSPYMGEDSVKPFLEFPDKWAVVLALTSNKGSEDFQMIPDVNGARVFERVVKRSAKWGSPVNMMYVVGATRGELIADVRRLAPRHFFLVPGVGAQGGSLEEVCRYGLIDEVGLLVNSSRGIIHASAGEDFAEKAAEKAAALAAQMRAILASASLLKSPLPLDKGGQGMEKPPKRRILIVNSSNEGTIAMCTLNLWKALVEDPGAEVKCIIKHRFPDGLPEFDNCDFYSDSPPPGGLKNLTSMLSQIRWLRKQKKAFKPGLTISACASCSALNILAGGKDRKIGIFHSPHRQARSLGRVPYLYMLAYFNFLFPFLDRLFCVSEGVRDSILQSFPRINPVKISVVYNAHDIASIRRLALEEIKDQAEKDIFSKPVYIYVGRFDANKAPERAVRAFAGAFPDGDEQLVFIGGNDSYSEKVRDVAAECNVSDRVHLLGPKANPCMYVARSKALVSCSFSEGLPGVIIEATALGIPVISTNSSKGVWEIMDCLNDYQAQMHGNHHTAYGTITPNNLPETENLRFLASAMKRPSAIPTPDNPFIQKVTFSSIRENYTKE